MSPYEFLSAQLAEVETQWSLGSFGAIAEFMRDPDEMVTLGHAERLVWAVTGRGGIVLRCTDELRLVAFETTTQTSWSQRVALCLPDHRCAMNERTTLTEIGRDRDALRAEDRDAVLFDLGVGALQVDVYVRVADEDLAAKLRRCTGRSIWEAGNPAMAAILAANPHRVFQSKLGRIEVYQPIPPPDGKSPEGPHTHVLPALLRQRRSHAATEQIPDGFIPCAHLYPPHPMRDPLGHSRPFNRTHYDSFQAVLGRFGNPEFVAIKQRVIEAVKAGQEPSAVPIAGRRFARTNVRVALRQLMATLDNSSALTAWCAEHDRRGVEGDEGTQHHHR